MALCAALLFFAVIFQVQGVENEQKMRQQIEEMKQQIKLYMQQDSVEFFSHLLGDKVHAVHDFRVIVQPKTMQCYYQETEKGTTMDVDFECLSSPTFSSSGKISAFISLFEGESAKPLKSVRNERRGEFDITAKERGTYAFCIDNTEGKEMAFVQVVMEVWRLAELPKFHMQNQMGNDSLYHVYDGLFQISTSVSTMRAAVTHTRSQLKYDYLTRISNLSMVNNFSIVSMILIIAVCFIQLHFVKKMFGDTTRGGRV